MHGNSPAFGFSIMVTVSFGVLSTSLAPPAVVDMLLFGVAAAVSVALLEGLVSRGFQRRLDEAPEEVRLLGTAMNFLSVGAGVGAAILIGPLIGPRLGWPAGGFLAASAYLIAESVEILLAQRLQAARGDREAEPAAERGSGRPRAEGGQGETASALRSRRPRSFD